MLRGKPVIAFKRCFAFLWRALSQRLSPQEGAAAMSHRLAWHRFVLIVTGAAALLTATSRASAITNDNFNGPTLDPAWTYDDPAPASPLSFTDRPGFLRTTLAAGEDSWVNN